MSHLSSLLLTLPMITLPSKLKSTITQQPPLFQMFWRDITEPSLLMVRQVLARLTPCQDLKTTKMRKVSCQGLSKTSSKVLPLIQTRPSFWSELAILKFTTRKSAIFSARTPKTGLNFTKSLTPEFTSRICLTTQLKPQMKWERLWPLAWRTAQSERLPWTCTLRAHIHYFRSRLNDKKLAPMASLTSESEN